MRCYRLHRGNRLFILILITTILIAESGLYLVFRRNQQIQNQAYLQSCQTAVSHLTEQFGQMFAVGGKAVNTIFGRRWYNHFRSAVGYYQSEFDEYTRLEIVKELNALAITYPYAQDLLLITPSLKTVINKNGWYSLEQYRKLLGIGIDDMGRVDDVLL